MSACPICGKPTVPDYHPFCSRRCADVDLGRWLNESYSIPAEGEDEPEETPANAPPPKAH
ncbi:MAG: DNA gyrase inhibitor YacG [Acetobacteraceae bacterium]|nr:MAG: DNA gyrase inhibitor YacG [Acetobacteraceae bacterium]